MRMKYFAEFGETLQTKVVYFSSKRKLEKGLYLDGDRYLLCGQHGRTTDVINVNELNILGRHNYENVMAAVCNGSKLMVYRWIKSVEVLKTFPGSRASN